MRVLYVTNIAPSRAPSSDLRIKGVSLALEMQGIEVIVAYVSSRRGSTRWRRAGRSLPDLLWVPETRSAIIETRPDAVIVYGTQSGLVNSCARTTRQADVPLILDSVEWYESRDLPLGRLGPFALANHLSMNRFSRQADRAIVISTFLQDHFQALGLDALLVPPLFPPTLRTGIHTTELRNDGPLRLCFAGAAGGKDRQSITNLIGAASRIDPSARRYRIDVIGPSRSEFPRSVTEYTGATFHGRVSHAEALRLVASSGFTVIQRPRNARYARAGFPSKVAESLVLGTPILGNLSSDLGRYLSDGQNAVVLAGDRIEDMESGLRRAFERPLKMTRRDVAARADIDFGPATYAAQLSSFIFGA